MKSDRPPISFSAIAPRWHDNQPPVPKPQTNIVPHMLEIKVHRATIIYHSQYEARSYPMAFESVRFWINAFIPDSVCVLKGDLFAVEIPSSPIENRFFAGDQRSFSDNPEASSRMHSEVTIVGLSSDLPEIAEERQICGESLELDDQGNVLQRATASTDRMKFENLRGSQTVDPEGGVIDGIPGSVQIDFFGSASLPLIIAPDIDYSGTLVIDRAEGNILVSGATNGFPSYEIYCSIDGGSVMILAHIEPISPIELIGSENQPFNISTRIVL